MARMICRIGAEANVKDALLLASMKEKYGKDIILVTPEQAKEQGLNIEEIANIPVMKITALPITMRRYSEHQTGKEQRRERRKKERMSNKRSMFQ